MKIFSVFFKRETIYHFKANKNEVAKWSNNKYSYLSVKIILPSKFGFLNLIKFIHIFNILFPKRTVCRNNLVSKVIVPYSNKNQEKYNKITKDLLIKKIEKELPFENTYPQA